MAEHLTPRTVRLSKTSRSLLAILAAAGALLLFCPKLFAAAPGLDDALRKDLIAQWNFMQAKKRICPDLAGGKYPAILRDGCKVIPNPQGDNSILVAENRKGAQGIGMPSLRRTMDTFTVSFWLLPYETDGHIQNIGAPSWDYFQFHSAPGGSIYVGVDGARLTPTHAVPPGTLEKDRWQFFTYTYADNMGRLYKNGRLVAFCPTGKPKPWEGFTFSDSVIGCVGPVYIHARMLEAAEVKQLFDIDRQKFGISPLSIDLDNATYGFFQKGTPLRFDLGRFEFTGPLTLDLAIEDVDGKTIQTEKRPLDKAGSFTVKSPERCGIYWAKTKLLSAEGKVLLEKEHPFAITVPLPPIAEVNPDGAPLGSCFALDSMGGEAPFIGMKWSRIWGVWNTWYFIEREQGKYDWSTLDKQVEEILKSGMEVMYTVHGIPDWYAIKPAPKGRYGHDAWPPRDIEDFKRFVRALAQRYKGKIKAYDIFNEQIRGMALAEGFDRCTSHEYFKLLKGAYEAIKEVDPGALVLGINDFPLSPTKTPDRGMQEGFEEVFKLGGARYMDVLAIHTYNLDSPSVTYKTHHYEEKTMEIIKRHEKPNLPLWDTESSFVVPPRINGRPMTEAEFDARYAAQFKPTGTRCCHANGGIIMAPEHRSACWEIQASINSYASGVRKRMIFSEYTSVYGAGRILEKGVAIAAMARVLGDTREWKEFRLLDLGTDTVAGAILTLRSGKSTAVIWSCDEKPAHTTLIVKGSDRVFRGTDFLGNPSVIGTSSSGMMKLTVGQEPVYLFDIPADLKGVFPLKLETADGVVQPGASFEGTLVISNPFDREMSFAMRAVKPESWKMAGVPDSLKLKPGEVRKVKFVIESVDVTAKDTGLRPVTFELLISGRPEASVTGSYLMCSEQPLKKAPREIVVDGDPSDWGNIPALPVNTYAHIVIGKQKAGVPDDAYPHWLNPQDLSYNVKFAWNAGAIYFLVEVTDGAEPLQPAANATREATPWEYDCANVYMNFIGKDTRLEAASGMEKASQILIVPEIGDTPRPCQMLVVNPLYADAQNGFQTKVVGRKTPAGYLIEGMIRGNPKLEIAEGAIVSLDVAIDDRDVGRKLRKTQMTLFGLSETNQTRPQDWGRYKLVR